MAPKKKNGKPKANVPVVHNPHAENPTAHLIPLTRLNKLKVDTKAVKILKDSNSWNEVLLSKDRKDMNNVLGRIQGLTDPMRDQISEAVNKIMEYDVDVFTKKTVESLQKECQKKETGTWLRRLLCEAEKCVKNCYTADELRERLHEEFDEEFGYRLGLDGMDAVITELYDKYIACRKEHMAYSYMSSIRAEQRKEQKDKQEAEPKELVEEALEKKVEEALEHKVEEALEHKVEEALEKKVEEALEKVEEALEHKVEEALEHKVEVAEHQKEPASSRPASSRVNRLMDALTRQEKMLEKMKSYQPEIAREADLHPLASRVIRKLNSVGEEVTYGIGKMLTSPMSESSLQSVSSEIRDALSELQTTIKERIERDAETRAADAVANVTVSGSIQERLSLCILEHNYEEVFTMALDTDDPTLGWLLSKVKFLLRFYPAERKNIQALLVRLAPLVTAEAGEYTGVFNLWFEGILTRVKTIFPGLEITEEVRVTGEHLEMKNNRQFDEIHRKFSDDWL